MKKYTIFFLLLFICITNLANAQVSQLWGMASTGGFNGDGSIIKINEDGSAFADEYSLYDSTGSYPQGDLIKTGNNVLYGMTNSGGAYSDGVIFSFNPSNNIYTDVYDFNDTAGANPYGSLILASDNKFYGMTVFGGVNGFGVLFSFDPSNNTYSDLHDFNDTLGGLPYGNLMQASNGKFYGITSLGGDTALNSGQGFGVMFSYDPSDSSYDVLHQFNYNDGAFPRGSLIQATNNKLYGITAQGGVDSLGELFSFTISDSVYTPLHDFTIATGSTPLSSLIQANDSKLYGLTNSGGVNNVGVIFNIDTLGNSYTDVHDFDTINGANPYGGLLNASNNKLYGMTYNGGANNAGVIFSYNPDSTTFYKLYDLVDTSGTNPYGNLIEMPAGTGIQSIIKNNLQLLIFPNPTSNQLVIDCSSSSIQEIKIENSMGQTVLEKNITSSSSTKENIDISSLPQGLYFVTVISQNQNVTGKIIISR